MAVGGIAVGTGVVVGVGFCGESGSGVFVGTTGETSFTLRLIPTINSENPGDSAENFS